MLVFRTGHSIFHYCNKIEEYYVGSCGIRLVTTNTVIN